ncbi:bifunctional glycosyltransferase/CDP-glycerol:glycerophosphate glycerophosphotransferase [Actinomadura rudentiformis]|uniref:Glycosyltransferase n=1 Tax=Actinomadura rudentiformis TaxID=359158 RepID=A0A6H9YTZ8_9ACTN|nr:bifunctional glycosyltransferase/CDP-glycerol:glycerophosphate glycerophosphotransferase [Actinomadura rudentiformis]KAB2351754.1 glycosyltransferase [Actinomadura rudentiformis]
MTRPVISIVVPFHNEEAHLAECLESLARQTLRRLEVIMVDDGSTDAGAVIAKTMAGRDGRFVLVQQENAGVGAARNAGVRRARAEYLAFVDAHDVVVHNAYDLLVESLRKTGSDLACGNVLRMESGRTFPSRAHREAFECPAQRTHITRCTALLRDRRVWNKVYRRSFWDEHGLSFARGRHVDAPVSVRAHVLASAVDVLDTAVYSWRKPASIPGERRDEPRDLEERMAVVTEVCDVLAAHAPKLSRTYHRQVFGKELELLVKALPKVPEADQARLLDLGVRFVERADRRAIAQLDAFDRLWAHLLGRRMLAELLEVMAPHRKAEYVNAPVTRQGWIRPRWYARYPYFEDRARGVPRAVYDVTGELEFRGRVDTVEWRGDRLLVGGFACIGRLDVASAGDARIKLWLQDARGGGRVELAADRVRRPDVTAELNHPFVCYDWAGFAVEIEPSLLTRRCRQSGEWELHAEVVVAGTKRSGRVGSPPGQQTAWLPSRQEDRQRKGAVWIQPVAGPEGFAVRVKPLKALVTGHRRVGTALELDGWTSAAWEAAGEVAGEGARPRVVATSRQADLKVSGDIEVAERAGGRRGFRAVLPLEEMVSLQSKTAPGSIGEWEITLTGGAGRLKPALAVEVPERRYPVGAQEVALTRTRYGNLLGLVRPCAPVVTEIGWSDEGRIRLAGDFAGEGARPASLIVRHNRAAEEYTVPLEWAGRRFTAAFAPEAMPALGSARPMTPGTWQLFAVTGEPEDGDAEVAVLLERAVISELPEARTVGAHEVSLLAYAGGSLHVRVRLALAEDERGAHAQERLKTADYPRLRATPLRDLAVFDSYMARQYSCNPRAVYEELVRQGTDLECVWVSRDGQFTAPHGARTVLVGTRDHYEALARARYIVGNEAQWPWFVKRPDQTYVQCWHGTPLKKLSLDVPALPHLRQATLEWVEREVPRWDVLVSPNPFTSPIMRQAYRYQGEILESGYPRNDLLSRPEGPEIAAEVRRRLGIPADKRIILYVPTWRDDLYFARGRRAFELALDLGEARAALGHDHVLLLRTHYLVTDRSWSQVDDFVVDVSRYPDIADLYLAADVLVTDYSSAMFDFAVTGKPMVFFAYDLEKYRDHVRGFYLDFEAEAPGPLLRTSAETIAALRSVDEVAGDSAAAYAAFVDRFCPYDDGHAAERVIRRMFELGGEA